MRILFAVLACCASAYAQNPGGQSVCTVTNSPTSGYVLTASTGVNCQWLAAGSASVTNPAISNAVYMVDTGSANAISGAPSTAYSAYSAGTYVIVKVAANQTGTTTININSLGAKSVTTQSLAALPSGTLAAGGLYLMAYDGTEFQLIAGASGGGGGSPAGSTGAVQTNGGGGAFGDSGCTASAGAFVCASYSTNATTPGADNLVAGTGNISALPSNSAGFAAPVSGGTSFLFKLPSTATAGVLTAAAPATGDGVNESAMSITALQGTDTKVMTAGTVSGTGSTLCTDANGGATTTGCSGGGTPGGTSGQPQYNASGSFAGEANTVVVPGGTGALAGTTFTAGTTYLITANDTESTQVSISVNNVTIECRAGVKITRSAAITLFAISGSYDVVRNCIIDGGSETASGTGPLFAITGSNNEISNNIIQNPGTSNPVKAAIYITTGNANAIRNNTFPNIADSCVTVVPNASTVVADTAIEGNYISFNPGATSTNCIYLTDTLNASASIQTAHIVNNRVEESGTGAIAFAMGDNIYIPSGDSPSQGQVIAGNSCFPTARSSECFHLFGLFKSVVANNTATDNGYAESGIFHFGDTYDTAITGNAAQSLGSYAPCFQLIDFGRDSVTGNTCTGIFLNDGSGAFAMQSSGSIGSQSVVSGNVVRFSTTYGGVAFYLVSGSGTYAAQDNLFTGNLVIGTNTTGQIGFELLVGTGSITNNSIYGNHISSVPTGISIGAGVASTMVGQNAFDGVTTPVSDSGTGSLISTHTVRTTTTLSSGAGTITFSGLQVFTSSSSFDGSCRDATTPANSVTVSISSGTSVSLTGTGTDSIHCTWSGY